MENAQSGRTQAKSETAHYIYVASIDSKNGRKYLRPRTLGGRAVKKFGSPVTDNRVSKIYVIKNRDGSIVYVGKTSQSIASRFRQGLNPQPNTGYHGYHWQEKEEISIHCFVAPWATDDLIEGAEAELVFLIRTRTGSWPQYQTEIHFSNMAGCKALAEQIAEMLSFS